MIYDLFLKQAKALKNGSDYDKPKKFTFMLEHQNKFEFVTSFLTRAEITRELISAHDMEPEMINRTWTEFMNTLNPKYIEDFKFDRQIINIVEKVKMKLRTMVNFFHLFIAIEEDAYFVSGDKQIVEKIKEANLYDKVLTYIELQKLAASYPRSSCGES